MAAKRTKSKYARKPRGPAPEVLKIEGNWKDAMRKMISKKRPVGGWPKPKRPDSEGNK
jgi:hypothetical protein